MILLSQQIVKHKYQYHLKIVYHLLNVSPKIDETRIDDAEDLDLIMPMYNLIKYSSNYFETTGSLWLYSEDETNDLNADIVNDDFKSFKLY